ncbi:diaminopimelate decarboxylase [Sinimarinibacterium sp. NLF-5-8]|uniref:diaminopimelate decarboxylase n=1 Tax=Sinimarinibacterium sp. NLF-5-8 TaxID=2698684 RepID=UPI00137BA613|nr:diaminopimelate decarboxylase [Sinimarinibacterium sp. NLF-5-8]QHS10560.1 diaminopimelate decarboxylase [Sinimarinibacterium sp. NLF-5-8]
MNDFEYRDGVLHAENVSVADLAQRYGTPCYIYSRAGLTRQFRAFDEALSGIDHRVCFAVKANSNLAVLQVLARLGAGFDIVSGGELQRVLRAGGDPAKVVFSGVGKTRAEMQLALEAGIDCFNVESSFELHQLNEVAQRMGVRAPIALRVNPDVDPKTHPYISTGLKKNKFGVAIAEAESLYLEAATMAGIRIKGVASHIGSQLLDIAPLLDALDRVLALVDRLAARGIGLVHIDCGGGLGVRYKDEVAPDPADWAAAVKDRLRGRALRVITEPGRAISGNAGVLVTRVLGLKGGQSKAFAVVDAAMNDLLRPTLYQAWMEIVPVTPRSDVPACNVDVVGPVCETGDWLGQDRLLALKPGDLLAVRTAGAYGFVMASNYNTRARPVELLVDGDHVHVARARESFDDLIRGENLLP